KCIIIPGDELDKVVTEGSDSPRIEGSSSDRLRWKHGTRQLPFQLREDPAHNSGSASRIGMLFEVAPRPSTQLPREAAYGLLDGSGDLNCGH
ncbi:hypothetical protein J0S82_002847, partial [Galemys pyrenaicus]